MVNVLDRICAGKREHVAAAKKLMADAGYPNGFSVTLDCPNDRYNNDEQICQAIAAMLAGGLGVIAWWLAKRAGWTDIHEVYVGLVVSTVVYVTATLTLSPRNPHPEPTH